MGEFLAPQELRELTHSAQVARQDEWLTEQGIPHRIDRRRIIVSREHVRAWLEGRPLRTSSGPNWAAVA